MWTKALELKLIIEPDRGRCRSAVTCTRLISLAVLGLEWTKVNVDWSIAP